MIRTLTASVSLFVIAAFAGCIANVEEPTGPLDEALAGPAPGTVLGVDKKAWEGTLAPSVQDPAGALPCGRLGEGVDKRTYEWEFPESMDGVKMDVKGVLLTLTSSATTVDNDLYFYDLDGEVLGSGTTFTGSETIEVPDTLKPGTYKIVVVACTGVNSSFKLVGEATHVAA